MLAAIDIGTNTVRLLLGRAVDDRVEPITYHRIITRLGGSFSPRDGLAPPAMARTLAALEKIADLVGDVPAGQLRAVGTEALRRAPNAPQFLDEVRSRTGLAVEIIHGEEEARLSARGVLAALVPCPETCLIFDIGGGSTEFILWGDGRLLFQRSYPLGVVSLCERSPEPKAQLIRIAAILARLQEDLETTGLRNRVASSACPLVGTAGTVTTLAAMQLSMTTYDWRRVNNLQLSQRTLARMSDRLQGLSPVEREELPGMEKGRGDLILPGLRIVLALLDTLDRKRITVSDFGLLEGVLLSLAEA